MVYWELEREPSDGQFDLFADGRVVRHALGDERYVADALRSEGADEYDMIELPNGSTMTVGSYLAEYG